MARIRFKYAPARYRTGKYDRAKIPAIPVILYGTKQKVSISALVDSGADFSLLNKEIADLIGVGYFDEEKDKVGGIGGEVEVRRGKIEFRITDGRNSFRQAKLHIAVPAENTAFGEALILGRKDFFERYVIEFREKSEDLSIKEITERT
ncbi:hypothetical protein AUJ17_03715 [Candidatus Micrarchaeota archaeon CG1_02_47_40]|nr:MAG: hypothetical protein AUJ17_03715 [Candidatus Micrarchaeota archaeon CG1_02_47_40]